MLGRPADAGRGRATSCSPYFGADLPGTGTTMALAGLALLLAGGGGVRLWQHR